MFQIITVGLAACASISHTAVTVVVVVFVTPAIGCWLSCMQQMNMHFDLICYICICCNIFYNWAKLKKGAQGEILVAVKEIFY